MAEGDGGALESIDPWQPPQHQERCAESGPEPGGTGYVVEQGGISCGAVVQLPQICLITSAATTLVPIGFRLSTVQRGNGMGQRVGGLFLLGGVAVFAVTAAGDLWGTWSLSAVNYFTGLTGMLAGSLLYYFSQSRQMCHVQGFICRYRQMARRGSQVLLLLMFVGWWWLINIRGEYPDWVKWLAALVVLGCHTAIERVLLHGLQLRATELPGNRFLVHGFSSHVLDQLHRQVPVKQAGE